MFSSSVFRFPLSAFRPLQMVAVRKDLEVAGENF
jgi:hypothetical protein